MMLLLCLGAALAGLAGAQENRSANDPVPILQLGVAPCNHSVVPVQHFTTDAHAVPQTEEIYVGGLPCLPDHYWLGMKLTYREGTPEEYEPPGFIKNRYL